MPNKISMKHLFRQTLSIASYYSGACSLARYMKLNIGARILCFHGINPAPANQYAVLASDFSQQMRFLAKNYKVVTIDRLVESYQTDREIPANLLAVSIDDGYQDFYFHAYPVLRQFDIPATVFLPTGSIDRNSEYASTLPQSDFLTWNQIREMHQNRIDFGSHTVSHTSLKKLNQQEVQYELEHSKLRLESELDSVVEGFSYPYGTFRDIDTKIEKLIADVGYSWAVTAISGTNNVGMNQFALRRTIIVKEDGLAGFKRSLEGAVDGWFVMQKIGLIVSRIRNKNRKIDL